MVGLVDFFKREDGVDTYPLQLLYYIHKEIARFFFIRRDKVQPLVMKGIISFSLGDEQ